MSRALNVRRLRLESIDLDADCARIAGSRKYLEDLELYICHKEVLTLLKEASILKRLQLSHMNLNHDIATNVNEIKNLQDLILEYYTTGEISTL